jgi:hypothetical protein
VGVRFGLEAGEIQPDLFGEPRERGCRRHSKGRGVAA